ncbi:MAG: hypothetical protein U1E36_02090 [Rickettsiales bacterium]
MNFKEEQIAKIREIGEEAIDGGSKPVKDAMSKAKLDGIVDAASGCRLLLG